MDKYNLDQLVKVSCHSFCETSLFVYKKEKNIFGFTVQKEGVYKWGLNGYSFCSELPEEYILLNGVAYLKPRVSLFFQKGCIKEYYFDFTGDAIFFTNTLTTGKNWIS